MIFIATLLRSPARAVQTCFAPDQQTSIARISLLLIVLGGGVFGLSVGSFRGSPQLFFAALKIPAATLLTLATAGPAFYAIATAFGRRWDLRSAIAITLSAGARSSLVLFALAPALALAVDFGEGYSLVRLGAVVAYGLGGLSGLSVIVAALGPAPGRGGALLAFAGVFLVVGAQSAWLLRPYIGDPRDTTVPLFAHGRVEGGVVGALWSRR